MIIVVITIIMIITTIVNLIIIVSFTPGFLIKKLHIKKFRGWVSVKKRNSVNCPRLK